MELDRRQVDFEYDGEMGADVALDPELMALYPFCRLKGPANVLIMPALHTANVSAKLLQQLGGGLVIGPLLVGLTSSVQIVPMNATVSDILNIAAIAAHDAARGGGRAVAAAGCGIAQASIPNACRKPCRPGRRHLYRPAALQPAHPAGGEAVAAECRPQRAGDMWAALAPIEQGRQKAAPGTAAGLHRQAHCLQQGVAARGQCPAVWPELKLAARQHRIGQCHPQPARQMIVAGACGTQGPVAWAGDEHVGRRSAGPVRRPP